MSTHDLNEVHNFDWKQWVCRQTDARRISSSTCLQELWNGYGTLLRLSLEGAKRGSVILKRVRPPSEDGGSFSHQRKLRSYEVETNFYRSWVPRCGEASRVAACFGVQKGGGETFLLLEDLTDSGYQPVTQLHEHHIRGGLRWLADFHARFLNKVPDGLWMEGTYWRLGTRQKEYERMHDGLLKERAIELDERLRRNRYRSLVHGDAKPPNFCWAPNGDAAAVDFQYVGGGCGIRDVALFLDRSVTGKDRETSLDLWLEFYLQELSQRLAERGHETIVNPVVEEWRALYCVAWSDYCRYRLGWGSLKELDSYSRRLLESALKL